jgi:tetratricopeptide (TPR) repeat protein
MLRAWVVCALLSVGEKPLPAGHPPIQPPTANSELPAGHPPIRSDAGASAGAPSAAGAPSSDELLKKLDAQPELKTQTKTFDVALSLGKLYYSNARYSDAAGFLREAVAKAEPARVLVKDLSRKKVQAAPECPLAEERTVEALTEKAQAKAKAGQAAVARACGAEALGAAWLDAQRLLAQAQFLQRMPLPAVETLDALLDVVEDAEARYTRAAILVETSGDDRASLQRAKADLEILARAGPHARRAEDAGVLLTRVNQILAAGGVSSFGQKQLEKARSASPPSNAAVLPPVSKEMMDAVQNTERTPELEQGLQKLVEGAEDKLAREQFQEALDDYKRVVPFQPENGRARAGMAWALVGLNRQPMAERIWSVAVSGDAKALDTLGETLKAKGNARAAKALWEKLAASAPQYAQQARLSEKLK